MNIEARTEDSTIWHVACANDHLDIMNYLLKMYVSRTLCVFMHVLVFS